jgi:hypothetical protein
MFQLSVRDLVAVCTYLSPQDICRFRAASSLPAKCFPTVLQVLLARAADALSGGDLLAADTKAREAVQQMSEEMLDGIKTEAVVGLRGVEGEDARPLWLMWAAMTHPGPAGCCTKPPKKTAPVIRALRTAVASRSPIALENVARPEMQAWLAAPTRLLLALGALDPRQVADPVIACVRDPKMLPIPDPPPSGWSGGPAHSADLAIAMASTYVVDGADLPDPTVPIAAADFLGRVRRWLVQAAKQDRSTLAACGRVAALLHAAHEAKVELTFTRVQRDVMMYCTQLRICAAEYELIKAKDPFSSVRSRPSRVGAGYSLKSLPSITSSLDSAKPKGIKPMPDLPDVLTRPQAADVEVAEPEPMEEPPAHSSGDESVPRRRREKKRHPADMTVWLPKDGGRNEAAGLELERERAFDDPKIQQLGRVYLMPKLDAARHKGPLVANFPHIQI